MKKKELTQAIAPSNDNAIRLAGCIIDARYLQKREDGYLFDVGSGEKGLLRFQELPKEPKASEDVKLYVEGKAKNGFWILSQWKVDPFNLWVRMEELAKSKAKLAVQVVAFTESGLIVNAEGLRGFIPKRQIDSYEPSNLGDFIGKELEVVILKFNKRDGSLILSRRAVVEEGLLEAKEALLKTLQEGQIFDARVRQVVPYGVFVDIGSGVEGLVHRSNLTWGREEPSQLFHEGDTIKVQILEINQSSGKIAFDHKLLVGDPWKEYIKTIEVDQVVKGKVVTLANFGAFVSLAPSVEGMVHISELTWTHGIRHPKQVVNIGDELELKIIQIDEESRRIKLSLKQLEDNPWIKLSEQYVEGDVYKLPISGIAEFGLFVKLNEGQEGLIHASDIDWSARVDNLAERFTVGDEVECKLLSIDVENERASLGIKQLTSDPWEDALTKAQLGSQITVPIARIVKFGAFATIVEGVQGLIHISEISEERIESVHDVLKVDEEVTTTVIRVDHAKRRISLSITAEPFTPSDEEVQSMKEDPKKDEPEENPNAKLSDIFPESLKK